MKKLMMWAIACAVIAVGTVHARAQATAPFNPKDLAGQWQGSAQSAAQGTAPPLRVVFVVTRADGGGWKTVFNYIDLIAQGNGIPRPANLTLQGSTVKIAVPGNSGVYEGQLSDDGKTITGTWTQGGPNSTLNLVRTTTETAWEIPKPPPPPKPMAADANPSFDVATIKPSSPDARGQGFRVNGRHFSTLNTSLADVIGFAYGVHPKQIVGAPDWMDKDKFDIDAVPDGEGQPNDKQWKSMLQKLLVERFQLKFHHDQRELSVFALTIGKDGPKNITKSDSTNPLPSLFFRPGKGGIMLPAVNATIADWTGVMQAVVLDRPVVDKTGLVGRFDFSITWSPDESQFNGHGPPPPPSGEEPAPSLSAALSEQLGLRLDAVKIPADVMVIDHVEKPSAN